MNSWTNFNPRTGLKIKDYEYASHEQVLKSLTDLHQGFERWKKLTFKERQKELQKVIAVFEKNQQELTSAIHLEMGKSLPQAQAEVKKCLEAAKYLCEVDFQGFSPRTEPNPTYAQSQVIREPLGVILSVLPWNYPAWQGFRAFFPNMLAGNTILLKHSEVTPQSGELMAKYFKQAGCSDLLQHCLFSHELTEQLVADSRLGGVSITGSVKAGKVIAEICAKYFKKNVLELGGSDPALFLEDADLEAGCKSVALSRLQNAGQVCISAKRLIIPRKLQSAVLEQLKKAFDFILHQKEDLVGPLAQARFKAEYNKVVSELKQHSTVIYEKDLSSQNLNDHTAYVNPCVLLFEKNHQRLKETEVFGPCLIVIPYDTVDEAISLANSTVFGLGASVYGWNREQCYQVAAQLQAGQVTINDMVKSDVCLPFGGYKMSGYGREVGSEGFLEFTQIKVISEKNK